VLWSRALGHADGNSKRSEDRLPLASGKACHPVFVSGFSVTVAVASNPISPEMTVNSHSLSGTLPLLFLLLLSGCATGGHPLNAAPERDPLERSNRAVFAFNERIDQVLFKPAAEIYREQLPPAFRAGVSNFFRNLAEPTTVLNDILQGRGRQTINDGARFAINTTLGLFGLFDVAGSLGLAHHHEDYGQTLARWGVPAGPYLVLPLFGPSNVRDVAGKLPALYLSDPLFLISDEPYLGAGRYGLLHAGFRTLHAIDLRAQLLSADSLVKIQLDPYLFLREAYNQRRQHAINNYQTTEKLDPAMEEALFGD